MQQQVHAHKVLNQIKAQPMTEAKIREFVVTEFGPQVQFHTCKLSGMSLDDLLMFFRQQRKIVIENEIWHINDKEICQH